MMIFRIIRVELIKIRKRQAPWIMLGLFLISIAFYFLAVSSLADANPETTQADSMRLREGMRFPNGYDGLLQTTFRIGTILAVIFASLLTGSEYSWGTLRQVLSRGIPRTYFLVGKLVAIFFSLFIAMLITLFFGTGFMLAGDMIRGTTDFTLSDDFGWAITTDSLRVTMILIVYACIGFAASVITRSSAAGLGAGALFVFAEVLIFSALSILGGFWAELSHYAVYRLADDVLMANKFGQSSDFAGDWSFSPDWAAAILFLYIAILMAITFITFGRRDLKGAA